MHLPDSNNFLPNNSQICRCSHRQDQQLVITNKACPGNCMWVVETDINKVLFNLLKALSFNFAVLLVLIFTK